MEKLRSILKIEKVGLLELMFAFYPIIAGYGYGSIQFSVIWPVIMDLIAITRKKGFLRYPLLFIVFAFVIAHEVVVLFIDGFLEGHINLVISFIVIFVSIFIIAPALDYKKLVGSLYFVSYIVCVGIIYHFVLLLSGARISPIPIPFLPSLGENSRLFQETDRPCSFFWEPASFVSFMLIPLFISLINKEWRLMLFFLFCIFLSTSTNGLYLAPIMVLTYVFTGGQKFKNKVVYTILLIGMLLFLFNSPIFEKGLNKLETTDYAANVRVSNGPWLVSQMPSEHIIFGMPTYTADLYFSSGYVTGGRVGNRAVFYLSDFWRILVTYGIFGLILHLLVYLGFVKKEKTLWPLIIALLVAHFSIDSAYKPFYLYQFCFIIAYIQYRQKTLETKDNIQSI